MSTSTSSLVDIVGRFHAGEADASDAIFEWIEQAALVHVSACVDQVTQVVSTLGEDDPARIFCWKGLAHALCYDNQFAAAAQTLAEAVALAARLGRDGDQATLLLTMVQPLERLGRTEEAEDVARRALSTFTTRGDDFSAARAMVNLGVVRRVRGDSRDALAWFERARPALSSHLLAAGTLETNVAEALLDLDRFEEAAQAFTRARDLFEQGGHTLGMAIAEGNLADVFSRLGRIDEATLLFASARERFAACDAPADAARLLAEEAEAFSVVGAYRRAIRLYETALPGLQAPGMTIELARAHMGHGLSLLRMHAGAKSIQALRQAVELASGDGTATLRQDAQLALVEAFITTGQLHEASELVTQLVPHLVSRPAKHTQAMLCSAAISLSQGDDSAAKRQLDTAEALLEATPVISSRLRYHELRARAALAQHDAKTAWSQLEHALQVAERFRGSIRADFIRASFAEAASELFQAAIDVVMRDNDDKRPERLFHVIEQNRARALVESVAGRVDARSSTRHDAMVSQLNAMYATASRVEPEIGHLRRIAELEAQLERESDRADATRSLSTIAPMQLASARQSFGSSVAIMFYMHDERLHAMLVDADRAHVLSLPVSRQQLVSLARRHALAVDVATRTGGAVANVAMEALAAALAPFVPHLGAASHVTVVPCRELQAFPISAIVQSVCDAQALHTSVTLAPSITAGLTLRASLRQSSGSTLVVGVADESAPQMEDEARAVAACYRESVSLLGRDGTADAFLAQLPSHDIVHIATHCVFDPEFPMASRLKLADRWVAARELYGSLRPGSVVVLAGCESGRTSDAIGEDRFGLIRAMLVGGASLVIASQWRLHDEAASSAFPLLHQTACRDSAPPAVAFARALAHVRRLQKQNGEAWHVSESLFAKGALL